MFTLRGRSTVEKTTERRPGGSDGQATSCVPVVIIAVTLSTASRFRLYGERQDEVSVIDTYLDSIRQPLPILLPNPTWLARVLTCPEAVICDHSPVSSEVPTSIRVSAECRFGASCRPSPRPKGHSPRPKDADSVSSRHFC